MTANITPNGEFAFYSTKGIQIIDLDGFVPTIFSNLQNIIYYYREGIIYSISPPYTESIIHDQVDNSQLNSQLDYHCIARSSICKPRNKNYAVVRQRIIVYAPKNAIVLYSDEIFDHECIVIYAYKQKVYSHLVNIKFKEEEFKDQIDIPCEEDDEEDTEIYLEFDENKLLDDIDECGEVIGDCVKYYQKSYGRRSNLIILKMSTGQFAIIGRNLDMPGDIKLYKNHITVTSDNETRIFSYTNVYDEEHYITLEQYPDFVFDCYNRTKSARKI